MANLSALNPAMAIPQLTNRRQDAIDALLEIGTFTAIAASTSGAGIRFKAEKVGGYRGVVTYLPQAVDGTNFWTVQITGADNSSYTNEVVLASVKLGSGTTSGKAYIALDGAAVASLMDAAGEDEAIYVRAKAVKAGTAAPLTGQAYLTCTD